MSGVKDNLGGLLLQSPAPITDNMLVQQARSAIRAPVLSTPRAQSFIGAVDSFNKSLDDYSSALADGIAYLRQERLGSELDLSPPEEIKIAASKKNAPSHSSPRGTSVPESSAPLGAIMEPPKVPQQMSAPTIRAPGKSPPSMESLVAQVLLGATRSQERHIPQKIALPKPRYI